MFARTHGAALQGVEARIVDVEVHLGGGLPSMTTVGLPDTAVREGLERVRVAIASAGFRMPGRRAVISLAPAELPKQGASLDLPIAAALLASDGQLPPPGPGGTVLIGELGLDGSVRPVRGALAASMAARREGFRRLVVPAGNAEEAALVDGIEIVAVERLHEVAAIAAGAPSSIVRADPAALLQDVGTPDGTPDLADVRGQAVARRALEIAAAGGHHLLLCGPPGTGKSMLARRLPGILPPLSLPEALEVTLVRSAVGVGRGLATARPFRAPHHGVSVAGLVGGGAWPRPGEVTRASRGVLFLDELPEFRREALEALRQPLEDGYVTIGRARATVRFPARFALAASMNPCPCGHHGSPDGSCACTPGEIRRYLAKLSGPLLDRFDLVADVPRLDVRELASRPSGERTRDVRERVARARKRQSDRTAQGAPSCNAALAPRDLARWAAPDRAGRALLLDACRRLALSARGHDRSLRVARTIADLDARETILADHVAEALQFRGIPDRGGRSGPRP